MKREVLNDFLSAEEATVGLYEMTLEKLRALMSSPNRSDLVRGDCADSKGEPRETRHSDWIMNKSGGV